MDGNLRSPFLVAEGLPRPLPGIYPQSSLTSALAAQKARSPNKPSPVKKPSPKKLQIPLDNSRRPQANCLASSSQMPVQHSPCMLKIPSPSIKGQTKIAC